jgi:ATP-dependent DNA helicase PIF1
VSQLIQEQFLDAVSRGVSPLFLTGKAGTGKSTLVRKLLADRSVCSAVVAPTGVAALLVNGLTIHRFFGFPFDVHLGAIERGKIRPRSSIFNRLQRLIIDEVSMLRADLLDCVDAFLRRYGPLPHQPFGGVQIIFVGDLHQLPPIVSREEMAVFATQYATPYFFSARSLQDISPQVFRLDHVYRQQDNNFLTVLNAIRNGVVDTSHLAILQQCVRSAEADALVLTTTNKQADSINAARLKALSTPLLSQQASMKGSFPKEMLPTAELLEFKVGARVMLLTNDNQGRYVNGTVGRVTGILTKEKERLVEITTDDGELVQVPPYRWDITRMEVKDGEIEPVLVGRFEQYPFRLAWAVTIHKSQGQSFDRVHVDLAGGIFASGQLYVALSRCRTLAGLSLAQPVQARHAQVDKRVEEFLAA